MTDIAKIADIVDRPPVTARSRPRLISRFINWNKSLSRKLTPTHQREFNTFSMYYKVAGLSFSMPDVHNILDVGAGSRWTFPLQYKNYFGLHLTGIDIDAQEMDDNEALDSKFAADACGEWPLEPQSVDLITAFSGVEHFHDNQKFLDNCAQTLRPGGSIIANFPNALAPFALANRILPQGFKEKLLAKLHPTEKDIIGFRAHYNKTEYNAFAKAAKNAGLEVEYYVPGYFWSGYMNFITPLCVLVQMLNYAALASGLRALAGYHLFILRKPGPHAEIKFG